MDGELFDFENWADDADGWDQNTGAPGLWLFSAAVQVWSIFQKRQTTVGEAALAFNCRPERIIEAVNDHHYMFLAGDENEPLKMTIEHDGE